MPDISDVNGDNTLVNLSLDNAVNGLDLQDVRQIIVTDPNGTTLEGTNIRPTATQVLFDYGDMIAGNMKFGQAALLVIAVTLDFIVTGDGDNIVTGDGDRITTGL